jgi:hypothetical protein
MVRRAGRARRLSPYGSRRMRWTWSEAGTGERGRLADAALTGSAPRPRGSTGLLGAAIRCRVTKLPDREVECTRKGDQFDGGSGLGICWYVGRGIASIGTSWLASRSAATAQREKVQLEWRQQHREFQIKAATELQEILVEFARATGQIRHIDEMREAEGKTGKSQIDSILSELYSQHIRRINVLLGRIDSQAVQGAFADVKKASIEITMGIGISPRRFSTSAPRR